MPPKERPTKKALSPANTLITPFSIVRTSRSSAMTNPISDSLSSSLPFANGAAAAAAHGHGCVHLAEAKSTIAPGVPAYSAAAKLLLDRYREAVQRALINASRGHAALALRKVAAASAVSAGTPGPVAQSHTVAPMAKDDDSAAGKKRKKLAHGGIDPDLFLFEKTPLSRCVECDESMGRLHACLYCERIGCWKIHMQSHIQQEGHIFAMDQHHFTVFCASCNDYVYDVDMERILAAEKCRMEIVVSQVKDPSTKRLKLNEWRPSIEEAQKLKAFSGPVLKCAGLRGLRNMGATCFMNVILQSLIHNPLLRLHFLSDRHNQNLCANRRVGKICVACEMDNLFTNFYSGQNTPYGPTSFLYSIWKTNSALAEYAQQDAHEFFIAVLNEVHNNCVGYENNLNSSNCPCVVHQVFCGSLQSEVTCAKCHNITSTTDPMLDLSLTIRHASKAKHSKTSRKKAAAAAAAAATVGLALPGSASATSASTSTPGDTAPNTADSCHLIECMERYFAAEKLTHYQCGNPACGKIEPGAPPPTPTQSKDAESIKHVTIKSLPPVLSIQLKRFEHSGQGSKVETFVKVPVELDMTPYTTRSVKTRTKRLKRESSGLSRKQSARSLVPFDSVNESIPENKYVLFSVINHQGGLETGHYTAFVKTRGQWFFFDDHNVQLASQRDVLSSNVYMCFYVRANYCMSPNSIVDVCGRTAPSTGETATGSIATAEASSSNASEYFEEEILASADVSPIRPR